MFGFKWGKPNELCWSFSEQCDLFKHSAAKPQSLTTLSSCLLAYEA